MFRTELLFQPNNYKFGIYNEVLTIGSCFAERIGEKLEQNKFKVKRNPFGTIFNPVALAYILEKAILEKEVEEYTFLFNQNRWYNYLYHSFISDETQAGLEKHINQVNKELREVISSLDVLIITFGSALSYQLVNTNLAVANCHKMPSYLFTKSFLSIGNIQSSIESIYKLIARIRPDIKIILTVSPVRHIKETLITNSISKSILRVAAHQLTESNSSIVYFPAYEIMMDDLRDYRFYNADMIHPNEVAEQYIWNKFVTTFFDKKTINFLEEWESIQKSIKHKPFYPSTNSHQDFIQKLISKIKLVEDKTNLDFSLEIQSLEQQL